MPIASRKPIFYFQHDPGDPPGLLLDWAASRDVAVKGIKVFVGEALPEVAEVTGLVILGGPMNIDEHESHPWLIREKEFVKDILKTKTPILGICLGGQMLARVLGAKVAPHTHLEIGWHEMTRLSVRDPKALREWPEKSVVFQYHQDRFEIPEGAVPVFTNSVCDNQGFLWGDRVVGLQFHPEATLEWVEDCYLEIPPDCDDQPHVHPHSLTRQRGSEVFLETRKHFFRLLDNLFKKPIF